jgi:hypothetical protein
VRVNGLADVGAVRVHLDRGHRATRSDPGTVALFGLDALSALVSSSVSRPFLSTMNALPFVILFSNYLLPKTH